MRTVRQQVSLRAKALMRLNSLCKQTSDVQRILTRCSKYWQALLPPSQLAVLRSFASPPWQMWHAVIPKMGALWPAEGRRMGSQQGKEFECPFHFIVILLTQVQGERGGGKAAAGEIGSGPPGPPLSQSPLTHVHLPCTSLPSFAPSLAPPLPYLLWWGTWHC